MATEIGGTHPATIKRTFWRKKKLDNFVSTMLSLGWTVELAGANYVFPFVAHYTVIMMAPTAALREAMRQHALLQLSEPEQEYIIMPAIRPPAKPL